jgi:putative oxygen-independent coproporphyrinogen III oxidase
MISDSVALTSPVSIRSNVTAAYVHVPFCRRRCYYCDFPISVVGDRPPLASQNGFGTIAEYIEVLGQEIRATASNGVSLQTVFLGGGTPSLLTVDQLEQVLTALQQQFGIAPDAEISMEIDPDTFDRDRLQGYRAVGVNRVSVGVQAFQTELLQACGRTHTREDVDRAVELIHQVGLTNFSFDLISGLPKQTLEHWQESLQVAIAYQPTHLSVYDLTVEPGTAFDRWYEAGVAPLPTDAMTAEMYRTAQQVLTQAGFQHYEVSNYAKPGFQCRHNRVYWENRPYYGFGMGAASYLNQQRFTRPRKRRDYYEWVQTFATTGQIDCPTTSSTEGLLDTLMLGLRLSDGLSLQQLRDQFGDQTIQQVLHTLSPFQAEGWVEQRTVDGLSLAWATNLTTNERRIHLTDPAGFLFSNQVLSALFHQLG